MEIIRKYYSDNIPDIQREAINSDTYKTASKQIAELEQTVLGDMTEEEREKLEEYVSALLGREAIIEEATFAAAFLMGARMMLDIVDAQS